MKKHLLIFVLIFSFSHFHNFTFAQGLRISLLTCTPGQALSETFGHSALRVVDSTTATDVVYNYGTFPFYEPGFYLKFIQGKLKYSVEIEPFNEFINYYQQTNRGITEQVLQLTPTEKTTIYHALTENIKPQNKYYQYDFFLDNCTTRLRDIIEKYKTPKPSLPAVMPTNYTFRQAIHQYLQRNQQPWSQLGIDLLLGAKTDAVMTKEQQMFLPDNLMHAIDSVKSTKLVAGSIKLFTPTLNHYTTNIFIPIFFFSAFFLLCLGLSISKNIFCNTLLKWLDIGLFTLVGLLGVLLVLMWVATNHSMTKDNYNLLWASPLFLAYPFVIRKPTAIAKKVSLIAFVYLVLVLCSWAFLPQLMNSAFLPIVILMSWRSIAALQH